MPELSPLQTAKAAKLEALDNWRNSFPPGKMVNMEGRWLMEFDETNANKYNSWLAMRAIVEAAATVEVVDSFDIPIS